MGGMRAPKRRQASRLVTGMADLRCDRVGDGGGLQGLVSGEPRFRGNHGMKALGRLQP